MARCVARAGAGPGSVRTWRTRTRSPCSRRPSRPCPRSRGKAPTRPSGPDVGGCRQIRVRRGWASPLPHGVLRPPLPDAPQAWGCVVPLASAVHAWALEARRARRPRFMSRAGRGCARGRGGAQWPPAARPLSPLSSSALLSGCCPVDHLAGPAGHDGPSSGCGEHMARARLTSFPSPESRPKWTDAKVAGEGPPAAAAPLGALSAPSSRAP